MKMNEVTIVGVYMLTVIVMVEGLYNLKVQVHNYTNNGKCPGCLEVNSDMAGCCDRHGNLGLCESEQRCDSYFTYFVRRLDTVGGGENCSMSAANANSTNNRITSQSNIDDADINFNNTTVLGLKNPFTLRGLDDEWNGTQLLVEVCDEDPVGRDDLIDKLLININANSVMVGVETPVATYSGMFGFTTLSLSYSIQCVVNFQGQTCSDCVLGYMGSQCDVNIDDCAGVSCSAHGVCLDGINSFTCNCDAGFTGVLCSETVPIEEPGPTSSGSLAAGVVAAVAVVLGVLLIMSIAAIVVIMKRKKRSQNKTAESEINVSRNVVYGIGEPVTEDEAPVVLTNNVSYTDTRQQLKTNDNICYIPSQRAVSGEDYEYITQPDYDYI